MQKGLNYKIAITTIMCAVLLVLPVSAESNLSESQIIENMTGQSLNHSLSSVESTADSTGLTGAVGTLRNPGFLVPLLFVTGLVVFFLTIQIKEQTWEY